MFTLIFPFTFLISSTLLGFQLFKKLRLFTTREEMIIPGMVFGLTINTLFNYLLAYIFGINTTVIIFSQIVLLIAGGFLFIHNKDSNIESSPRLRFHLTAVAILSLLFFTPLFTSRMLAEKSGDYYSGIVEWGDLALHTILINTFLNSETFPPSNPLLSGNALVYPPLMDFLSAIFVATGSTLPQSLYLPSIIFSTALICLIFQLAYHLTKKLQASIIAPIIFAFNGGLGFIYFIYDLQNENRSLLSILTTLDKDYAKLTEYGIQLGNVIVVSFIPQRSFLLGYSIGIIVILFIYRYFESKNRNYLLVAGLLSSVLPLSHPHSLIALAIFISSILLINFRKSHVMDFIKFFAIPFIILAGFPVLKILFSDDVSSSIRLQLFWMKQDQNPVLFYLKNLGLYLPLSIMSLFFVPKKLIKDYLPFVVIFIVVNIIVFQPWDYDNTKIIFYPMIATAILISYVLAKIWQDKSPLVKISCAVLILFTTLSGILSVLYEAFSLHQLYSKEGIELAENLKKISSPQDVILTSDQHNHPIPAFSGRKIVMGYRGWLWTWGYDYRQRERDILDIYQGLPQTKPLLSKYNISYVVIGPTEKQDFLAREDFFDQNFNLALRTQNYKIYDVRQNP